MKNSEIYSQKKYVELYKNNKFLNYLRTFHIYVIYVSISFFIFLGIIFNNFQFIYKSIIILLFILHFHWDIFKECILSYYQKRLLNKIYIRRIRIPNT